MHYGAKHPDGAEPDPAIAVALEKAATNKRMTCSEAHDVAHQLDVQTPEVGKTIDLLEYRIIECQMGLFGYEPDKKILVAADLVSDELRDLLQTAAADGQVSCASCWGIAGALGVEKMAVAAACERLGLKIKPCQLGAF